MGIAVKQILYDELKCSSDMYPELNSVKSVNSINSRKETNSTVLPENIEIKEDLPIKPFIDEVLTEQQICTMEHTLEYWPKELYMPGPMVDRTSWQQWEQFGSNTWQDRARNMIQESLDNYNEEPIEEKLDQELRMIMCDGNVNPDDLPVLRK